MPEEGLWTRLAELYDIYIIITIVLIPTLIFIWKKGIKPLFTQLQVCFNTSDKIEHIFQELMPNGGTSLKDRVDRTYDTVNYIGERQRALLSDDGIAHCEMDAEGKCTWINRTYARLVERTPSEVMGNGWHNCIAPKERERVVKAWFDSVKEDREISIDFNFETPTGELKLVRGMSYKMTNPEGETIGFMGKLTVL